MAKRKKYTEAFKRDAVRLMLARGTRTVTEVADGLGVSQSMLHPWHQRYGAKAGGSAARSQEEHEDVEQLRRRLRELEQENALTTTALVS